MLATAYECGSRIFTSSPGDSSIGMNVAAMALRDSGLTIAPNRDGNQSAASVYYAMVRGWPRRGLSLAAVRQRISSSRPSRRFRR